MHGQNNIKLCNAEQANRVHQYKNTKIKLYKNNSAIWYNKMCRARQLTPTYANSPLLTSALNGRLQSGTITEAAVIQLDLLKMSIVMLETC
jgi:hypothetical protein